MGGAKRGLTARDLERIHDEHVVAMYRHGLALLRDENAVRDILQDVFLKLAEGRGSYGEAENERAYLLRMVHHAAIDRMRRTLEMTVIDGIKTTIPLHLKILADPDFVAGRLSTSFMERFAKKKDSKASLAEIA